MFRAEIPSDAFEEIKEVLSEVKKIIISVIDSESFRNVVPLFLEEVGEVRGEERLDVEGSAGGIRAY
ncbi:MAG: hypothetical protein GXO07_03775, partial [Crenarchaeota archaeon]|nr:hypothetical protein [Thermoproteota archaeon]